MANIFKSITIDEIKDAINALDPAKDPGPMLIAANFFKYNIEQIAPIIQNIMESALQYGIFPSTWKRSYLIPIPKKGATNDVKNYRGIAIQSIIPKIFDKILTSRLQQHLTSLIPSTQHGFTKQKNTISNFIQISLFITDEIKKGNQVDVIYFDLSKAFDVVDHVILAQKLAKTSIPFALYIATMKFVIGRTYQLKIDGEALDIYYSPKSSVPKGSHCGPILFNSIAADISTCTPKENQLSYADDTKFFSVVNTKDQQIVLQNYIDEFYKWSKTNKIDINAAKTYHYSYNGKKKNKFNSQY